MKRLYALLILPALLAVVRADPLTVAISLDIPPYIAGKASSGLEVDVIRAALPEAEITFEQMPYAQLETAVSDDVALVSAGVRETLPGVFYSRNYVTFLNTALSKSSDGLAIHSIADLAGHRIVTWEKADQELGPEFASLFGPDGKARGNYVEVADQRKQVEDFWEQDGTVIVIDRAIFDTFSRELGYDLATVTYHDLFAPVTAFRAAFADPKLRDRFNAGLEKLCHSGAYDELLKEYAMQADQSICE